MSGNETPGPRFGDVLLARKVLGHLGFAVAPSCEPYADERVDRVAKIIHDACSDDFLSILFEVESMVNHLTRETPNIDSAFKIGQSLLERHSTSSTR